MSDQASQNCLRKLKTTKKGLLVFLNIIHYFSVECMNLIKKNM